MTIPFRPTVDEIPLFPHARNKARRVMRHLGKSSLLVWVMYADDSIGLHKFNANGSHRRADSREGFEQ